MLPSTFMLETHFIKPLSAYLLFSANDYHNTCAHTHALHCIRGVEEYII